MAKYGFTRAVKDDDVHFQHKSFTNMNKAQRRAAIKEAQDYFNNCIGGPSR
jgi:hypothetical protein